MYQSISIILYKSKQQLNNEILQYPTVGNYDYIGIESKDEIKYPSECKFDNCLDQDFYSIHKFYASLHNKEIDASKFFDNKTPYMFVSMIHFNYNCDEEASKQFSEYYLKIEKKLANKTCIIYDSLDCCDIIIFLKSNQYKDGIKSIQDLDGLEEVKYSYSILSFDNSIIQSDKYKDEPIDKVTICGIIDNYKFFNDWFNKLEKIVKSSNKLNNEDENIQIDKYGRMGNEDVIINIRNFKSKIFFKHYYEKDGCFNTQNDIFSKSLIYSRTHIDDLDKEYNELSENNTEGIDLHLKRKFIEACCDSKSRIDESIKRAAIQVLNSCDYLSKDNFALDIRDCIKRSSDLFLAKVRDYRPLNNTSGYDSVQYNESIKKYTSGIMSIVNGSLQADRMFFQVPGFNAVLYDVPSKLIVFYTAFVYEIADLLNDLNPKDEFAFLVCPDLYQYTHISKLFNEENRDGGLLLKVRIPINSLFYPKRLLLELTHEVAHYVGKETRNRNFRGHIEVNMLSTELLKYILNDIGKGINNFNINKNAIYPKLHKITVEKINKYVDEEKNLLSKSQQEYEAFFYHQAYYKDILVRATCRTLNDKGYLNDLFKNLSGNLNIFDIDFNDYYKIRKNIDENIGIIKVKCSFVIDGIHELLKESYADLIMIQVLGIPLEEYVLTFYKPLYNLDNDPSEILSKNNIGERIASILFAYDKEVKDLNIDLISEIVSKKNIDKYDNSNQSYDLNKFIFELKKYTREEQGVPQNKSDILTYNTKAFNAEYLKKCKNTFIKNYENESKISNIRNIYDELKDNNLFNHIETIRRFIAKYRDVTFMNKKTDEC